MNSTRRMPVLLALLLSVVLAAGCAEDPTGPAAPELAMESAAPTGGSLRCYPQPYAVTAVLVGPSGGIVPVGRHRLIIPEGALSRLVLITAEAPTDTLNSVRFGPEGLTFNPAALPRLRMDYSNCPGARYVNKRIVYTDEKLQVLEELPTSDDRLNADVWALLRHFSRYAINY